MGGVSKSGSRRVLQLYFCWVLNVCVEGSDLLVDMFVGCSFHHLRALFERVTA